MQVDKQINKLIDLYQVGNIDFSIINDKIQKLNDEKQTLEFDAENFEDEKQALSFKETKSIIKTIPEVLDSGNDEDIKNVVHSLINSIIIYEAIEINWKFQ